MARIAGVDLPRGKRIEVGLTYIFGIGQSTSQRILAQLDIDPDINRKRLLKMLNDIAECGGYVSVGGIRQKQWIL